MKFWKIIVLDTIGVVFMIAAILTGWLPGPGGIPLFIVGLSLFAINHDWAERYIDILKKYADRLGDLIFIETAKWQLFYDVVAPIALASGVLLIINRQALWMLSLGIFLIGLAVTLFLGNRHRYRETKKKLLGK